MLQLERYLKVSLKGSKLYFESNCENNKKLRDMRKLKKDSFFLEIFKQELLPVRDQVVEDNT